jgi:hypothetical protein
MAKDHSSVTEYEITSVARIAKELVEGYFDDQNVFHSPTVKATPYIAGTGNFIFTSPDEPG